MARPIPCATCYGSVVDISAATIRPHPMFPYLTVAMCPSCSSAGEPKLTRSDSGLSIRTPPPRDDCYHCGRAYLLEDRENSLYCSATCEYLVAHPLTYGDKPAQGAPRPSAGPCDCQDYQERGCCSMVARPPTPYPEDISPIAVFRKN